MIMIIIVIYVIIIIVIYIYIYTWYLIIYIYYQYIEYPNRISHLFFLLIRWVNSDWQETRKVNGHCSSIISLRWLYMVILVLVLFEFLWDKWLHFFICQSNLFMTSPVFMVKFPISSWSTHQIKHFSWSKSTCFMIKSIFFMIKSIFSMVNPRLFSKTSRDVRHRTWPPETSWVAPWLWRSARDVVWDRTRTAETLGSAFAPWKSLQLGGSCHGEIGTNGG